MDEDDNEGAAHFVTRFYSALVRAMRTHGLATCAITCMLHRALEEAVTEPASSSTPNIGPELNPQQTRQGPGTRPQQQPRLEPKPEPQPQPELERNGSTSEHLPNRDSSNSTDPGSSNCATPEPRRDPSNRTAPAPGRSNRATTMSRRDSRNRGTADVRTGTALGRTNRAATVRSNRAAPGPSNRAAPEPRREELLMIYPPGKGPSTSSSSSTPAPDPASLPRPTLGPSSSEDDVDIQFISYHPVSSEDSPSMVLRSARKRRRSDPPLRPTSKQPRFSTPASTPTPTPAQDLAQPSRNTEQQQQQHQSAAQTPATGTPRRLPSAVVAQLQTGTVIGQQQQSSDPPASRRAASSSHRPPSAAHKPQHPTQQPTPLPITGSARPTSQQPSNAVREQQHPAQRSVQMPATSSTGPSTSRLSSDMREQQLHAQQNGRLSATGSAGPLTQSLPSSTRQQQLPITASVGPSKDKPSRVMRQKERPTPQPAQPSAANSGPPSTHLPSSVVRQQQMPEKQPVLHIPPPSSRASAGVQQQQQPSSVSDAPASYGTTSVIRQQQHQQSGAPQPAVITNPRPPFGTPSSAEQPSTQQIVTYPGPRPEHGFPNVIQFKAPAAVPSAPTSHQAHVEASPAAGVSKQEIPDAARLTGALRPVLDFVLTQKDVREWSVSELQRLQSMLQNIVPLTATGQTGEPSSLPSNPHPPPTHNDSPMPTESAFHSHYEPVSIHVPMAPDTSEPALSSHVPNTQPLAPNFSEPVQLMYVPPDARPAQQTHVPLDARPQAPFSLHVQPSCTPDAQTQNPAFNEPTQPSSTTDAQQQYLVLSQPAQPAPAPDTQPHDVTFSEPAQPSAFQDTQPQGLTFTEPAQPPHVPDAEPHTSSTIIESAHPSSTPVTQIQAPATDEPTQPSDTPGAQPQDLAFSQPAQPPPAPDAQPHAITLSEPTQPSAIQDTQPQGPTFREPTQSSPILEAEPHASTFIEPAHSAPSAGTQIPAIVISEPSHSAPTAEVQPQVLTLSVPPQSVPNGDGQQQPPSSCEPDTEGEEVEFVGYYEEPSVAKQGVKPKMNLRSRKSRAVLKRPSASATNGTIRAQGLVPTAVALQSSSPSDGQLSMAATASPPHTACPAQQLPSSQVHIQSIAEPSVPADAREQREPLQAQFTAGQLDELAGQPGTSQQPVPVAARPEQTSTLRATKTSTKPNQRKRSGVRKDGTQRIQVTTNVGNRDANNTDRKRSESDVNQRVACPRKSQTSREDEDWEPSAALQSSMQQNDAQSRTPRPRNSSRSDQRDVVLVDVRSSAVNLVTPPHSRGNVNQAVNTSPFNVPLSPFVRNSLLKVKNSEAKLIGERNRTRIVSMSKFDDAILPCLSQNVRFDCTSNYMLATGMRIASFWKRDMRWFQATLQNIRATHKFGQFKGIILYDDGDHEDVDFLKTCKWRFVRAVNSGVPNYKFSLKAEEMDKMSTKLKDLLQHIEAEPKRTVGEGIFTLSDVDLNSLSGDNWLTGEVICAFAAALLKVGANTKDLRFFLANSFIFQRAKGVLRDAGEQPDEIMALDSWRRGVQLHDIDVVLWPLNVSESHWVLTVGLIPALKVVYLDPRELLSGVPPPVEIATFVQDAYNALWLGYFEHYAMEERWSMVNPAPLIRNLNLPHQEPDDQSGCGVYVCLYIWALINGEPLPDSLVQKRDREFFAQLRRVITAWIVKSVSIPPYS